MTSSQPLPRRRLYVATRLTFATSSIGISGVLVVVTGLAEGDVLNLPRLLVPGSDMLVTPNA